MHRNLRILTLLILLFSILIGCKQNSKEIKTESTFPWCIVAYDSLERTPQQRIELIKELGFNSYAYDWRDRHLKDTKTELRLAQENNIAILSVWIWLNPKRDSVNALSASNEKVFKAVKDLNLKTTFWVGLSERYFKDMSQEVALEEATKLIQFVNDKAKQMNCKIALYNHKGWFGNPLNQIEIIKVLPNSDISIVYNFHHGHDDIDRFNEIVSKMIPYLSAVNLNGMEKDGNKILPIGKGDFEKEMINTLQENGFSGPWGILGHVEGVDVKDVLLENIEGLNSITK